MSFDQSVPGTETDTISAENSESGVSFPLHAIRRFRGKNIRGVDITDDDLLASSVEARPELQEPVNTLIQQGFSSSQIIDQVLENQDFLNSPELNPFEDGIAKVLRSFGSTLFGMVGDGIDLIDTARKKPSELISKIPGLSKLDPSMTEKVITEQEQGLKEGPLGSVLNEEGNLIPRSADLKVKFDELTNNQFSPVDETDAQVDEILDDIAGLVIPSIGGKLSRVGNAPSLMKSLGGMVKSLIRPAAQVTGGQVAKKGIEAFTDNVTAQEAAKMGTMFLLGLRAPKSAKQFAAEQQASVRARIPNVNVSATELRQGLRDLKADLRKGTGISAPEKKPLFKRIDNIDRKISRGEINLQDVEEIIKELNEAIGDPSTLQGQERKLKRVKGLLEDTFDQYSAVDPQLVNDFRDANKTFGAVKESERALKFIAQKEGIATKSGVKPGTIAAVQFRSGRPMKGLFTLGVNQVFKPYETMRLINASPSLQKFYIDAMKAAAVQDTGAYIRNMKKLDEGLEKETNED